MRSRLTVFRHGATYASLSERVGEHGSQAWKVVVGVDAAVEVTGPHGRFSTPVVVVPPYTAQAMGSAGVLVAFFAEPGSTLAPFSCGAATLQLPAARTAEALGRIARSLVLGRADDARDATQEALRVLDLERTRARDARAERALRTAVEEPELELDALAARLRISPTRLTHVVGASTGLSLRTHRLWHRTLLAVELLLSGIGVSAAAARAGFSDHAHFTRAFRRFFGRTPSSLGGDAFVLATYAERAR